MMKGAKNNQDAISSILGQDEIQRKTEKIQNMRTKIKIYNKSDQFHLQQSHNIIKILSACHLQKVLIVTDYHQAVVGRNKSD